MLSDYFGMSLDELVKDIDVQDVREKNLTDEKVASIFSDIQNFLLGQQPKIFQVFLEQCVVPFCI